MPRPAPAPAVERPAATAAPPAPLSFEERLALVNTAMTMRLDQAAVAYEVNTAHIDTEPVDLADVITVPLDTAPPPLPTLYPTPVAALLQRAHHRLVTGGWCKDVLVDEDGARCMLGAIQAEARGNRSLEHSATAVLMDVIRRAFGDVDSVPGFNDAWANGRAPLRMVDQAAGLADTRGL